MSRLRKGELGYRVPDSSVHPVSEVGGPIVNMMIKPGMYWAAARIWVANSTHNLNLLLRVPGIVEIDQVEVGPGRQAVTIMGPLNFTEEGEHYLELFAGTEVGGVAEVNARIMLLKVKDLHEFF